MDFQIDDLLTNFKSSNKWYKENLKNQPINEEKENFMVP